MRLQGFFKYFGFDVSVVAQTILLTALLLFGLGKASAQETAFEQEKYYAAVRFCRENSWQRNLTLKFGPMALSPDKHIMCFDGTIVSDMHVSLMNDLETGGLFVVRSSGGRVSAAIGLANLIRNRRATVVVYDYCVSACAEYFLTAPDKAYVLKGALVAYHNPKSADAARPLCAFITASHYGEAPMLRHGVCQDGRDPVVAFSSLEAQFFKERAIDPSFIAPPDTLYVRKRLTSLYAETGIDRNFAWTIHPRYYPHLFKTKIFFEAYPQSQDEVDEAVAKLGLNAKVIYDP